MINVDDLLGVKYRFNGRSKETGFDCYGLAIEVEKRFGHKLPDDTSFLNKDRVFENCANQALLMVNNLRSEVMNVSAPSKEGDIILFKRAGILNHIGIYLGNNMYIHCNKYGVHVDRLNEITEIGRVYTWL